MTILTIMAIAAVGLAAALPFVSALARKRTNADMQALLDQALSIKGELAALRESAEKLTERASPKGERTRNKAMTRVAVLGRVYGGTFGVDALTLNMLENYQIIRAASRQRWFVDLTSEDYGEKIAFPQMTVGQRRTVDPSDLWIHSMYSRKLREQSKDQGKFSSPQGARPRHKYELN